MNSIETQTDTDSVINGWSENIDRYINIFVMKLKYNRTINSFYYFRLKSKEGCFSWWIIILSTLTTSLNALTNIENEPLKHFFLSINIALGIFSIATTLIAAWMKKQQFVERINNIDRYVQKINILIEEIEIQLTKEPLDRIDYKDFKTKYDPIISECLSVTPMINPKEWKHMVYTITKYYPEIIAPDNIDENKLWPWFGYGDEGDDDLRPPTDFGNMILDTYHTLTYKGIIFSKCCCCFYDNKKLKYLENKRSVSDIGRNTCVDTGTNTPIDIGTDEIINNP